MIGTKNMTKKYKYSTAEAQLQPLAVTVVLTSLAVAGLLVSSASLGMSPKAVGAYQISDGR
jgi:hypothetical protein